MPSKLLIAAANSADSAAKASEFGVNIDHVKVDGRAVMKRVRRLRDRFVGGVLKGIDSYEAKGQLIVGRARFVGDHVIEVDGTEDGPTRVTFKTAVIASGSSVWVPPPYRALGADVLLDNGTVFEMEDLPQSVLIVGTGVVGLELGQAFHRLGVRTSLVGIGGVVGPLSDPKVKEVAREFFSEELDFRPNYAFESVHQDEDGKVVLAADGRVDKFDKVLIAAGRRPNLSGMGLEEVFGWNLRALPPVDERIGQIGTSHIFIAGDVSGFRPLLHEASHEGRITGTNAATFPEVVAQTRRTPLGVVFTHPQIAIIGKSHADLANCGYCSGEIDYSGQGRALVDGRNHGLVRIYARCRDGVLLGAEMFGPGVEHMAHLLAWQIQQRSTVHDLLLMPFYHPVLEEGLRTALQDLRSNLKLPARPTGCEELKESS